MGSSSSRIGSDRSSQPTRMNRTRRKLSSLLLCGLTSNSSPQSHVLELESPINSIENLPPASVESISSAGVSSPFFGSEPVCTSSKTSVSEPEESESCNSSAKNASTSYESQPIEEPVVGNNGADLASAFDTQSLVNEGMPARSSDNIIQENLDSEQDSQPNHGDVTRRVDSDTRALLVLSDSFVSVRMFGSGLTTSGTGILVVESGSASPDVGVSETNNREARRNSGGLFGATSSRHRYRRESGFPSPFSTTGLDDDFVSRDHWLLDHSGDHHHHHHYHHHGHGHGYLRSHHRNEERRRFRSQMSERALGGFDEGESFMDEEAGSFRSISHVVFLAHALSEVLDEIHRQPLSLSIPMLSQPAPVSVVDSFLLKSHKKMNASESGPNYVQQCYICLVDYEEGDKIRVLPCQHEYHAPCVDKWLKEVNGVCPVCRCNVCDAHSGSTSEVPA